MPESSDVHRVFIFNEENKGGPSVAPETLAVGRGDRVLFVAAFVAGNEADKFSVVPDTDVFQSISAGEKIPVNPGSPPGVTVRREAALNSVHHYDVHCKSSGSIDPILILHS